MKRFNDSEKNTIYTILRVFECLLDQIIHESSSQDVVMLFMRFTSVNSEKSDCHLSSLNSF